MSLGEAAQFLYDGAVRSDGVEVHRDSWPAAEEVVQAGLGDLSGPRGPGKSWKRLTANEAARSGSLAELKKELSPAEETGLVLQTALDPAFRWRTRRNQWLRPADMETRHLFNTVKMVWNHSAPYDLQFRPFRQYTFGPTYTAEYMKQAVNAMVAELQTRTLTAPQARVLNEMVRRMRELRERKLTEAAALERA